MSNKTLSNIPTVAVAGRKNGKHSFEIFEKLKIVTKALFSVTIAKCFGFFVVFGGDFGLSRLTSLQFIQYHIAGFYKPTIPQSPPSHLRDYSTCNNARLEFSTIFVPSFDPNEWCLKNGLHSGGLNLGPLCHESSALTTRPRLLALANLFFCFFVICSSLQRSSRKLQVGCFFRKIHYSGKRVFRDWRRGRSQQNCGSFSVYPPSDECFQAVEGNNG